MINLITNNKKLQNGWLQKMIFISIKKWQHEIEQACQTFNIIGNEYLLMSTWN
jgi:hypothetical protein